MIPVSAEMCAWCCMEPIATVYYLAHAAAAQWRLYIAAYRHSGWICKSSLQGDIWLLRHRYPTDDDDDFENSLDIFRKGASSNVHDKPADWTGDKFWL